jgi:hypothetical protein
MAVVTVGFSTLGWDASLPPNKVYDASLTLLLVMHRSQPTVPPTRYVMHHSHFCS